MLCALCFAFCVLCVLCFVFCVLCFLICFCFFCFFVKWYFLKVKSVKTHHGLQISIFFFFFRKSIEEKNSKMVDNLHPTEEGEAGEEPHGAPDDA